MSRYVSRERLGRLDVELSEGDRAILEMVARLRLVSGSQITRAHWPDATAADARAARRTLVRLTRCRVLARLDRRVGGLGRGSEAWTYGLDTAGQRLIGSANARRPRLPSRPMWAHVLAGSEVYVQLAETVRALGRELSDWQGEPQCWRHYGGPHGPGEVIKPDAYVAVRGVGYVDVAFVEVDTGSQSRTVIRAKLHAYLRYAATGQEQARTGVFPRVVFVTTAGPKRQQLLVDLAGELPPETWPLFAVVPIHQAGRLLAGLPPDAPAG